jgi:hypothetical protein
VAAALAVDDGAETTIRIGLLMPPLEGEGSEFRAAAEGAAVAVYRFGLSGAKVKLDVALDNGTAGDAEAKLKGLIGRDPAGVIVASAGPHLDAALAQVAQADVAVLLPYDRPSDLADGLWLTGPSETSIDTQLAHALATTGVRKPFVVTGDGEPAPRLDAARLLTLGDPGLLADEIVAALESLAADSVVIAASATSQATLAAAIQGRLGSRQVPIFLTPQALAPAFADTLVAKGSLGGVFVTIGPDSGDHVALNAGSGKYAAAFFTTIRLAAGDPNATNVFADAPFATVAQTADIPSHDAVVALVRAVEKAGSASPGLVKAALASLRLDGTAGLAGANLDFTRPAALTDDQIVTLRASTSDPALRPPPANGTTAPGLFWFAAD